MITASSGFDCVISDGHAALGLIVLSCISDGHAALGLID